MRIAVRRQPELPRPADHRRQVPGAGPSCPSCRARSSPAWSTRVGEGVTQFKPGDAGGRLGQQRRLSNGTHAIMRRTRQALPPAGFDSTKAAAFASPTRQLRTTRWLDRGAAPGRRDRAGAGRGRRRGHGGDADRWRPARGDRRAPRGAEKCALCRSLGADAAINYASGNLRDAHEATDRRARTRRGLRPGRRRPGRAGVPLHRLARALPGDRLRRRRHPALPLEPAAAQGRVLVGVFWATSRAASLPAVPPAWPSWRSGMPRARSSR